MELDEDDPDRFNLSGGLKHALEVLQSTVLFIIASMALFFVWVGVILRDLLIRKTL
ncbi:hypothetical protein [Methanosarcina sp.]|uniref:hypothetical protein n=1 Tax=Methanosarcina sp. TaxID=2213 RepID=UPI003BB54567